jgi:hypothetical protein
MKKAPANPTGRGFLITQCVIGLHALQSDCRWMYQAFITATARTFR